MFKLVSVRRIMGTKHLRLFVLLCSITVIACTPVTVEKIKENRKSKQFFYALSPQPIGFIRPAYGVGIPQAPFATFRQPAPTFAGYGQPAPFFGYRQQAPVVVPLRYYAPSVGPLGVASGNDLPGPTAYGDGTDLASGQTPFAPKPKPFATFPFVPPVGATVAKEEVTTNDEAQTATKEEELQLQFLVKKKPAATNVIEMSDPVEPFTVNEVYDIFRQKLAQQHGAMDSEDIDSKKELKEGQQPASNDDVAPNQAAVQETEATFGPAQAFIQQQETLADELQVVKVKVESQKEVKDEKASSAVMSEDEAKTVNDSTLVVASEKTEDQRQDSDQPETKVEEKQEANDEINQDDSSHNAPVQQDVKSAAADETKPTVEAEQPSETIPQNDFAHRVAEEPKPTAHQSHKEEMKEESHNQQADQPHSGDEAEEVKQDVTSLEQKFEAEEVKQDVTNLASLGEASAVMKNTKEASINDQQVAVLKNDEAEQMVSDAFSHVQEKGDPVEAKPVHAEQNLVADSNEKSEDMGVPADDFEQEVNAHKVDIPVDDAGTVPEVSLDEVQQIPLVAQDQQMGKQEMKQTIISSDVFVDSKPSFDVEDSTTLWSEVAAHDDIELAQPFKIHEENVAKDGEKIADYDAIPEQNPSFETEDSTTITSEIMADKEAGPLKIVVDEVFVSQKTLADVESATEINDEEGKLKEVENTLENVQAETEKQSDVSSQTGNDVDELVKAADLSVEEPITTEITVVEDEIKAEDVAVVDADKAKTVSSLVETPVLDNGHEAHNEIEILQDEAVKQKEVELVADSTQSYDEDEEVKLLTQPGEDLQSDVDWTAFRADPEVQGVKVVPLVAADETGDDQSDEQVQAEVEPQSSQDEDEQKEIEAAAVVNVIVGSDEPSALSLKTDQTNPSKELSSHQPASGVEEPEPVKVVFDSEKPETKEQIKEADVDVKTTVTSDEDKAENPLPEFVLNKLQGLREQQKSILAGDYLTTAGLDEMIANVKSDRKLLEDLYSTIVRIHVSDESSLSRMSVQEPENTNKNSYAEITYLFRKHAPFFHQVDLKEHKDIVVSMLKYDESSLKFLDRMKTRHQASGAEENTNSNIPLADQQQASDTQEQENPVAHLLLQELKSVQAHQNSLLAGDYLTPSGLQAMSDDVETNKHSLEKLYTLLATIEVTEDESTLVNLGRTEVQGADGVTKVNGLYRKYAHHLRGANLKDHKDLVLSMITHDGNALDFLARMKERMNESDNKTAHDVPAVAPALEVAESISNDGPEQVVEAVAIQDPDNTTLTETEAEEELQDEVEAVVEIRLPENADPVKFGTVVELSQDDIKEVQATYEKLEDSENLEPVTAGEVTLPVNQLSAAEGAVQDDNHLNLPIEAVQNEKIGTPLAATGDKTDDEPVETNPADQALENQKEQSQAHDEAVAPMEVVEVASYTVDEQKGQPILVQAVKDDAEQVLNEPVAVYVKETDAVRPTGDSQVQDEVEAIVEVHEYVSPNRGDTEPTLNDGIEAEVVDQVVPVVVENQLNVDAPALHDSKATEEMKDDVGKQLVQVEANPDQPIQVVFQPFADSEIVDLAKTNENAQTQYVQVEPVAVSGGEQGIEVIQRDSDPVESIQAVAQLSDVLAEEPIAVQDYIAERVEDAESVDALQPQAALDAQQEENQSVYGELPVQSQVLNPAEKSADPEGQLPNIYGELQVQSQALDPAGETVEEEYQQPASVEAAPKLTADEEKGTWLVQPVPIKDQDQTVEVVNDVPKEEADEPQREWTVKVQPTHNGNQKVKVIGFTADDHPETYSSPAEASDLLHGSRPNNKVLNADDNYVVIKNPVVQHSQSQLPENAQPEYLYDPVPVPVEQVISTEQKKPADIVLDDGTVVQAAEKEDLPAKLPDSAKFRKIVVYEKDGKWFYAGTWRKRKTL